MKRLLILLLPLFVMAGNILEEIDKNLNPTSFEAYKKLINIEPDGSKKEFLMWMIKKDKDKIANLFLKPATDNGRALLRLGNNIVALYSRDCKASEGRFGSKRNGRGF